MRQFKAFANDVAQRLTGGFTPGHPDQPEQPTATELLTAYIDQIAALRSERLDGTFPQYVVGSAALPEEVEAGRAILSADRSLQVAVVCATVELCLPPRSGRLGWAESYYELLPVGDLANRLLRRKLPYSDQDIAWILNRIASSGVDANILHLVPISVLAVLRSVERWTKENQLPEPAMKALSKLRDSISRPYLDSDGQRVLKLIDLLLGRNDPATIDGRDDWGHAMREWLDHSAADARSDLTAFIEHSSTISGTRPTKSWLAETQSRVKAIGAETVRPAVCEWLGLLNERTRGAEYRRSDGFDYPSSYIADHNADMLKGIAWACSTVADDRIAVALGDAALACYKKIPNIGARSTKAGNACVHSLAEIGTVTAIGQLQRIAGKVKLKSQRAQVDQALEAAAGSLGLVREDLDELAVPSFDLIGGVASVQFGDYVAELVIERTDRVDLRWRKPDGKTQKSVPALVKREFSGEFAIVKRARKEIREALLAQRNRIEQLMIRNRVWTYAEWRERYLDHPLVSQLARRLIWTLEIDGGRATACWRDGLLETVGGETFDRMPKETAVRLWHPIDATAEEVFAWREWLERHEVTQPFKQAHREVYILTDAERETETYSNRFAAHILRQHQFNALCQQRGWDYSLQGAWDSFNVPVHDLADHGLRAEYWVEGLDSGDEHALATSGIYLYVSTDQVRFAERASGQSVSLDQVPTRVFSEVMRDVDLFVGVGSIGNDPNWLDGGPERMAGYHGYWWDFSFGELNTSAASRRDLLARLLPKMKKLDGRWELDGRFLIVTGDIRRYKIHLGSGNILMEPNDQYLCIVPGRGAGTKSTNGLFLPFEGDHVLSIILSKALMLADDTAIADRTIVRQIQRSEAA